MKSPRTLLFLCSGNYYRSRFAEALFNKLAGEAHLGWVATSRGLISDEPHGNVGPISVYTLQGLSARNIAIEQPVRFPVQCSEADLAGADRIIALKEAEHRAQLARRYPAWPEKVQYWHVHDLDLATADTALSEIEALVGQLVNELKTPEAERK